MLVSRLRFVVPRLYACLFPCALRLACCVLCLVLCVIFFVCLCLRFDCSFCCYCRV